MQALPEGKTRVYAPSYMHLRDVDALVRARIAELAELHAALEHQLAENRLRHPVEPGSRICIEGRALRLELERGPQVALELDGEACRLTLPDPGDEEQGLRQRLSLLGSRSGKCIRHSLF